MSTGALHFRPLPLSSKAFPPSEAGLQRSDHHLLTGSCATLSQVVCVTRHLPHLRHSALCWGHHWAVGRGGDQTDRRTCWLFTSSWNVGISSSREAKPWCREASTIQVTSCHSTHCAHTHPLPHSWTTWSLQAALWIQTHCILPPKIPFEQKHIITGTHTAGPVTHKTTQQATQERLD